MTSSGKILLYLAPLPALNTKLYVQNIFIIFLFLFFFGFCVEFFNQVLGFCVSPQDATATVTRSRVTSTPLVLKRLAASVAACVTTAATTGWGLSVSDVDLFCTRIHREGRTTRRLAYVRFGSFYCDIPTCAMQSENEKNGGWSISSASTLVNLLISTGFRSTILYHLHRR